MIVVWRINMETANFTGDEQQKTFEQQISSSAGLTFARHFSQDITHFSPRLSPLRSMSKASFVAVAAAPPPWDQLSSAGWWYTSQMLNCGAQHVL